MINVVAGLAGQILGLFGQKGRANQEALKARVANMKRSLTDEFLVVYWFGPSVLLGLFSPDHYSAYVAAITAQQAYIFPDMG